MVSNTSVSGDLAGFDFEKVLGKHDQIGQLSRLERAFGFFAMSGEGRAQSIGLDGVFAG